MIDHKIEEALNIPVLQISEDNLSDDEDYESYAGGPSARRMKSHQKKKRRSGSLSRVFTGTYLYLITKFERQRLVDQVKKFDESGGITPFYFHILMTVIIFCPFP
jgi:hypothetical protein